MEFVRTNRDSYLKLSRIVRGMTVLAPLSVEETSAEIMESIARKCLQTDVEEIRFPLPCPVGQGEVKTPNA